MQLWKLIVCFFVWATAVQADRETKLCDEEKRNNKKKKKHNLRRPEHECKIDADCPPIQCIRSPCLQLGCHGNVCIADRMTTSDSPPCDKKEVFECTDNLQCPQVRTARFWSRVDPCITAHHPSPLPGAMCAGIPLSEL